MRNYKFSSIRRSASTRKRFNISLFENEVRKIISDELDNRDWNSKFGYYFFLIFFFLVSLVFGFGFTYLLIDIINQGLFPNLPEMIALLVLLFITLSYAYFFIDALKYKKSKEKFGILLFGLIIISSIVSLLMNLIQFFS